MKTIAIATAFAACATGLVGCAEPEEVTQGQEQEVLGEKVSQPIVNGSPASAYTEAALISFGGYLCSGSVIAPKIVLTAGHCVADASSWTVTAPYASNQTAKGTHKWTDYTSTGESVNPNALDVAVIILDTPITLSSYPTLASSASPAGTKAVNVGRIRNGTVSYNGLFYGAQVTLKAGASYGFPKAYMSEEIIESGDSGGPVYVGSGSSRVITAVNSGAGGGTQVLARVDLAYAKIQQLIAANGGSGSGGGTTPPPPPSGCSGGTGEAEPNDTSSAANTLAGTRCGSLATASDIDWYTWTVDSAGVAYDVKLTSAGDAEVLMWKWSGSAWSQVASTSTTEIAKTSSAAGKYVIAVHGGAAQSYTLKLTK